MALDPKRIAERLRQARQLLAYNETEVSGRTGISEQRLRTIEAAGVAPTGDEILILAAVYDRNFLDFVDDSRADPFKETDILFRRYGQSFTADDRRSIQEFLYLCEIEEQLQRQLNRSAGKFEARPEGNHFKTHGEQAAAALRASLGYDDKAVPRDVYSDFRGIGIHVFRRRLTNPEISGLYIEHPIAGHCVLVNYSEDLYRQRFSAAHEAAHALFDSSCSVLVSYVGSNYRDEQDRLREFRANRFASCYLLPPAVLKQLPWPMSNEQAGHWAQQLRVSTTALAIALKEAGIASQTDIGRFSKIRVAVADKIDPEASDLLSPVQRQRRLALLERGLSDYYVGLCFDAYEAGHISAGRLSEALRADHAEAREISVLYGRSIRYDA